MMRKDEILPEELQFLELIKIAKQKDLSSLRNALNNDYSRANRYKGDTDLILLALDQYSQRKYQHCLQSIVDMKKESLSYELIEFFRRETQYKQTQFFQAEKNDIFHFIHTQLQQLKSKHLKSPEELSFIQTLKEIEIKLVKYAPKQSNKVFNLAYSQTTHIEVSKQPKKKNPQPQKPNLKKKVKNYSIVRLEPICIHGTKKSLKIVPSLQVNVPLPEEQMQILESGALQVPTMVQKQKQISTSSIQVEINNQSFSHLFVGDIFQGFVPNEKDQKAPLNYDSQKQYLVKVIEENTLKKIAKTKLLYRYDPQNPTNFHGYIDNNPNIVLLLKLKPNNYLIAGFTEWGLKEGEINKGPGFLSSLTNKCSFYIDPQLQNGRLTIYDKYFFIFGNSELRLKIPETKVNSNFGIAHKFLKTKEKSPMLLLGQEERETQAEHYEIYRVYFSEEFQ